MKTTIIAAAIVLLTAPFATGAVIDADGHPGAGGLPAILDESTGLLWLDISYTDEWSYEQAIDSTAPGEVLEGWRPVTNAEALLMLAHASIQPNRKSRVNLRQPVMNLIGIWGMTHDNSPTGIEANFVTSSEEIPNAFGFKDFGSIRFDAKKGHTSVPVNITDPETGFIHIGVAMVKQIPEPTTAALALAALCLAMSRRLM